MDCLDKVVLITGASSGSGIGEATARELAAAGATVVLGARRMDRLEQLVGEIGQLGGTARCRALDVTQRADVAAFALATLDEFGRIDVIVKTTRALCPCPRFRR